MRTVFVAIGKFSVRFRWLVALGWILITLVSVRAFPGLSTISQSSNSAFLPTNSPSEKASQLAAPFQNSAFISMTLVVARDNGPLTTTDQNAIDQVEASIRTLPHVVSVRDLGVSKDGAARQASVAANVSAFSTGPSTQLVSAIRSDLKSASAQSGLEMHLTGSLAQAIDNNASSQSSQNNTTLFSILFIILLLLLVFRAPLAPLITLIPAGLVLALSGPVITGAANIFGISVSAITQVLLIVLVLGAGTDYGLFLIYRVREELRRGLSPADAVVKAVSTVGETITFSALTVMAALLSLLFAQFGFYQSLGPALAIGIFLMLLAGLTLLPALLTIFGRAVFWPTSTRHVAEQPIGAWGRLTSGLVQRPLVTLIIGVVFFGGLALGTINAPVTGFADQGGGPPGADSTLGSTLVARHYPSATTNVTQALLRFPQSIWSDTSALTTAQQRLTSITGVRTVLGPLTPNGIPLTAAQLDALHQQLGAPQALPPVEPTALHARLPVEIYNAYRGTAQYISPDSQTIAFIMVLKDSGGGPTEINSVPALRNAVTSAATAAGASQSGILGLNEFAYDVDHVSSADLNRIIPIVALLIALLLAVVLRSLIAPLYLVASVVLSYLAALGLVAIVFVRIGGQDGLNFVLPFFMFVFLMALGSDYNILVMTRIREEAETKPLREAVTDAIGITGGTVTTAGTILAGTFAVLGLAAGGGSGSGQIEQIALGIAGGVLMDTFLVRTLLVPSLVILLGKWNWWPSPLFTRTDQLQQQAQTDPTPADAASLATK
jgi:putative drug exporter of the RND superfamily